MTGTTNGDFVIRAATMADLEAAVAMFNLCSRAEIGAEEFDLEEYRNEWSLPQFNLETDSRVVLTPQGKIVGCGEVWNNPPHVHIWCWSRVHPDYTGHGIGTTLLQWSEERAWQLVPQAPEGARVVMQRSTLGTHEKAKNLFVEQGFEAHRHFLDMKIALDEAPPAPAWPEGITVRVCAPDDDFRAVYAAVDSALRDHWGYVELPFEEGFKRFEHFNINNPEFTPALWFLAMDGDDIAGMSLCKPKTQEDPDMGWVEVLGVLRPWRKRGVGLALLRHTFGEMYKLGKRKVGLGVDASSLTGATRLYEKAGMCAVRQYDAYEKELRAGEDISTQAATG